MTGRVVALWRYPVKSMMGEELNASDVTDRGLAGDRAYALIDRETGKVASAKHPRKWGRLFDFRAAFVEPPRARAPVPGVRITFPDGSVATSDEPDLDRRLSATLGRDVSLAASAPETPTLEEYWPGIEGHEPYLPTSVDDQGDTVSEVPASLGAPPGTFFDFSPIHLVTTSTLDRLRELNPGSRFEARRFRPNIVIEVDGETGFLENAWSDRLVVVGEDVGLKVVMPVPRCVMTTLPQGDLPKDPDVLRTVARHNRITLGLGNLPCVGVYADVARAGTIRRGDAVRVE